VNDIAGARGYTMFESLQGLLKNPSVYRLGPLLRT